MTQIDGYGRAIGSSREARLVLAAVLAAADTREVALTAAEIGQCAPAEVVVKDDTITVSQALDPDEFPPAIGTTSSFAVPTTVRGREPGPTTVRVVGALSVLLFLAVAIPLVGLLWRWVWPW